VRPDVLRHVSLAVLPAEDDLSGRQDLSDSHTGSLTHRRSCRQGAGGPNESLAAAQRRQERGAKGSAGAPAAGCASRGPAGRRRCTRSHPAPRPAGSWSPSLAVLSASAETRRTYPGIGTKPGYAGGAVQLHEHSTTVPSDRRAPPCGATAAQRAAPGHMLPSHSPPAQHGRLHTLHQCLPPVCRLWRAARYLVAVVVLRPALRLRRRGQRRRALGRATERVVAAAPAREAQAASSVSLSAYSTACLQGSIRPDLAPCFAVACSSSRDGFHSVIPPSPGFIMSLLLHTLLGHRALT